MLDLVGNRPDKNSVGHGKNVALYTGAPSRFFFATHELGDVFSAVDGATERWYPDQVIVRPAAPEAGIEERRQVCVTEDDVVVSRIHLYNSGGAPVRRRIEVTGDCRGSFDWRGKPGGLKETRRDGRAILLVDHNVYPEFLPHGLSMAIGGTAAPSEVDTSTPGAYRLGYDVEVPAHGSRVLTLACAIHRDEAEARRLLAATLRQGDPVARNRTRWAEFYAREAPRFECSDRSLTELYAFRWFLLKFSTAGGSLGLYKYTVVMEGRQAFQTYCCYSAPFMAFDTNWLVDPEAGFGQIANMAEVAYEDGRFPWYTSPRTNHVPLDHASKTGLSLLPLAAWKHYQVHGRKDLLRRVYPAMKRNMEWWISDRDPDGNGLFAIDDQLETGMDDLVRRWKGPRPRRYEAVDATSYAVANLRAVAKMAKELGNGEDARRYGEYADRAESALHHIAWDAGSARFLDRNPQDGERSDYTAITIFYPLFAGVLNREELSILPLRLLSEQEFWLPHPLPALSRSDPEFDPVHRYWAGPSWPAATCHVIEGFADTAKRMDRSLLPQAAELFLRAAANHLQPRPDFYERYDPFSGKPLSRFRDYMHSWWIDLFIRHVAGLMPQEDGSLVIDPLPLGLTRFALRGAPHRGHRVDVLWSNTDGLTVRQDGRTILRRPTFHPGGARIGIPAR